MGKSGGRKKKGGSNQVSVDNHSSNTSAHANGGVDLDSSIFLKRANELKEEGNKKFQNKDYVAALQHYDDALKLIPKTNPDRAVFHSNRAACLMQMKPIDYDTVIAECTMALQVQPRFVRALLRRARAFEAIGKYEVAMQDVQFLLGTDPNNKDALEIARRLRTALGPRQEAQQDPQSRPSPAALGASAVRGAPISGLGPCLPARPVPKKASSPPGGSVGSPNNKLEKIQRSAASENVDNLKKGGPRGQLVSSSVNGKVQQAAIQWRPLKLVYDHDIRLSEMPVNCSFKVLREIVSKRFPSSNSVLIKYKDSDGDLITITCTTELRLAESYVDALIPSEPEADKTGGFGMLRLHIVEVSPEQEPPLPEEEEKLLESEGAKVDEIRYHSSLGDSVSEGVDTEIETTEKEASKENVGASEDPECKAVEMDDWLFEFAHLFRTHVGIDPDAHIDLHELGMELCSEALEETVTSEEAQNLFDKAAAKFQEVVALAFFNWGNIHMCAARKRIPLEESTGKEVVSAQLQVAYDWVREKYSLAREKYAEALLIKPDFYEGLLALGQQQFEMAKLNWSFALAKKLDLSSWDPAETFQLFDSAEEKMKAATEMWEKLEEQRANELKDPNSIKKDDLSKRRKKLGTAAESELPGSQGELSPKEAAEQAAVMRSQIHLFWGNMLFERSQVECKLGMDGWKRNLDTAVERFKLAGASESDISAVLNNHCSNGDAIEGDEKKGVGEAKSSEISQTSEE
ncbi:BTB/POZ domain-containing protein [Hibiscus syriacus]|uniref:BTB/POZ domain-containing protein n=1 Tax=Hibiscus syriacus TaxID=106335 RepID=A0A6A2YLT5_HIBSY|nr:BTB/POZ domain-containing protein [Hibiscus syriacus]